MLHNFLRSLGRPSHPTKRASRRKFSPNARRSDAAIERLEERMLLSATNDGETDSTTVEAPENHRPRGGGQLIIWRVIEGQPVEVSDGIGGEDQDGDLLRFEIVSPPDIGTVEIDEDFLAPNQYGATWCHLTFRAPDGWTGTTSFTFRMFDGLEYSDVMSAVIYVEPDHSPTLEDQAIAGTQGQQVVGKLHAQDLDGDFLFFEVKDPPSVGGVMLIDETTGDFVYTPPKGFAGTVSFTYSVREYWGEPPISPATVTISIEPAVEPVHGNPHHDKPHHENPHQDRPPVGKPSDQLPTRPHSPAIASPSDNHPQAPSSSVAPAPADSHHDGNSKGKAVAGSEVLQVASIVVPPTSISNDLQPAKVTAVIFASDELNVSRSLAHSLRLTRFGEDGFDEADVAKPVSFEYRDVNGDRREDLLAVFELDWAELWDGHESAVLTGRLA